MSYLEELNKYTDSLNSQREHYSGLLNEASSKYGQHAQEQFDQITEAMNMAGGTVNALGMGVHGLARAQQSIQKLAKENGISTTSEEGGSFGYWRNKHDQLHDPRGSSKTNKNPGEITMEELGGGAPAEDTPWRSATKTNPGFLFDKPPGPRKEFDSVITDYRPKAGEAEAGADPLSTPRTLSTERSQKLPSVQRPKFTENGTLPVQNTIETQLESRFTAGSGPSSAQSAYEALYKQIQNPGVIDTSTTLTGNKLFDPEKDKIDSQAKLDELQGSQKGQLRGKSSAEAGADTRAQLDTQAQSSVNEKESQVAGKQKKRPTPADLEEEDEGMFGGLDSYPSAGKGIQRDALTAEPRGSVPNTGLDAIKKTGAELREVPEVDTGRIRPTYTKSSAVVGELQDPGILSQITSRRGGATGTYQFPDAPALPATTAPATTATTATPPGVDKWGGRTGATAPENPTTSLGKQQGIAKSAPALDGGKAPISGGDGKITGADSAPRGVSEVEQSTGVNAGGATGTTDEGMGGFSRQLRRGIMPGAEESASGASTGIDGIIGGMAPDLLGAMGVDAGEAGTALAMGGIGLEAAGGVGEIVGAGLLVGGILHDVLSKPDTTDQVLQGAMAGKIGFNPSAMGGGAGVAGTA